ncbi:folylpolyglutamate synthase [Yamadazyma tenuis]|uniref:Dihydrofolate synthetase n=1 Tax=Candida tenuis (strain ATCC 10573 / BCRC 21748 / CBS 615 / JCM 9827 / NBRC 10315 / NRRL Y-1498 / VKM Y-70) TaxID=590646 RepID=G3BFG9_CANTC|nr:folylpolyglutamate synthase [Yamadazyma tenuis ATCC 10573]EGV60690.1 folylpolyglutamate synthase [Yamadazyma tenuis ATCC 10573]WEJ94058.1 folylpolyglutamate synthase [Yamadazyma tenuis]
MGINLALTRISRLLSILGNPHVSSYKSIHIAGTNGKGSTVAYISSILTASRIRNGRFTSPHLLYYNDCISINNETYPLGKFHEVSELVKQQNKIHDVGCTEFELLTVTAFKIFELEKVEYAVIEVGLGGRLDATNVLEPFGGQHKGGVIVCGITKIGIDHEQFLGSTLSEIASEKAGIIKTGIPCVVDGTNSEEVLETIRQKAAECGSTVHIVNGTTSSSFSEYTQEQVQDLRSKSPLKGNYQLQNLSVALRLVELLKAKFSSQITKESVANGVASVVWPGRLQSVRYRGVDMLIDGAHNESAAQELGTYLQSYRDEEGLIMVVALSKGKSVENLVKYIANQQKDSIIGTKFSRPEGMPWVSSYGVEEVIMAAKPHFKDVIESDDSQTVQDILDRIVALKAQGDSRKVVVCGSLYLCSDVLRLVNS